MNAERRKRLEKTGSQLADVIAELEGLKDEEESALNNMPESLQESDRGIQMTENVDKFDDIIMELEDQLSNLSEID